MRSRRPSRRRAPSSLRAIRGAVNVLSRRTSSCATRSSRSTTRSTRAITGSRSRSRSCSRSSRRSPPISASSWPILHASIHLERIGDQSVTIAKLTKLASELEPRHDLVEGLVEMGERAEEMVRVALDSFSDRDVDTARGSWSSTSWSTGRTGASSTTCWRWRAPRAPRSGDADDRRLPLHRADRRQRRRHRRADRVPRHRRVPRSSPTRPTEHPDNERPATTGKMVLFFARAVLEDAVPQRRRQPEHPLRYLSLPILIGLAANAVLGLWWAVPARRPRRRSRGNPTGIRTWRGEACDDLTC